jgi:autotransporter-associated beta strand protein
VISDGTYYAKITKSGAGTLTLSKVNTYDGTFTLSAGTTTVDHSGALCGPGCDVVVNGGTLNLNNAAQTIENLNGTGGTINLALGHTLTSAPGADSAYSGTIAGQGALALTYAYTLALNGTNTYTGGTTVSAGTLAVGGSIKGNVTVGGAGVLKLNNASAMESGATINLAASPAAGAVNLNFTGTQLIKALKFGTISKEPGTWGSLSSTAQHKNAAFTGTGLLDIAPTIVIGAPSVTLTRGGPVTYTITYGGADSISLVAGDVTLNTTGTATGSKAVGGTDTSTRTVTISSITGDGTLGISIAAGTASDLAGNSAPAAGPSATFGVSNYVPSYGLNNKAVADAIMGTASGTFVFTVWGKVTTIDANSFYVDDGSSRPVKVIFAGHGLTNNDYVSARGTLDVSGALPVLTAQAVKKQN